MAKFFSPPAAFDADEADELVLEVLRKQGLTHTSSRWGEQVNTTIVGARLAEIFKTGHVIQDRKHLKANPDLAAWREDVVEELFGPEPLLHSAVTLEEEAARDRLVQLVWEYSGTSLTSPLNVALSEVDGFVLLRRRSRRGALGPGRRGLPCRPRRDS